ncbi:hypothetical protein C8J57DRAFT_1248399 [Mycena rebaudengoi]|nr:hypothetical protein C8J57DRAFT_1248399 [Mycena rebaudengoi]
MPTSVFSLPVPLILLVHLHILQYPHANNTEYDHNIFNPRLRGLRERAKTMQDMCYFLVGRVEAKREAAKKVLPSYPCLQPAETTAFRTSLTKFLENLRHRAIFPDSSAGKTMPPVPAPESAAWWWKDVVVRRSLLEECSGEKFERLLLALSTHALLKGSRAHVEPNELNAVLRDQPRIYMTRLVAFQSSRNLWVQSASLLLQQQADLKILRSVILQAGNNLRPKKYSALPTQKLLALVDSKLEELLSSYWNEPGSHSALVFLTDLSGIKQQTTMPLRSLQDLPSSINDSSVPLTPPPLLPIAAAHHPATLSKLSKRIFPKPTADAPSNEVLIQRPVPHASVALSGRMDAEARMLQALQEAHSRSQKVSKKLALRLDAQTSKRTTSSKRPLRSVDLNLWQEHPRAAVNFDVGHFFSVLQATFSHPRASPQTQLTPASLSAMGYSGIDSEPPLESRVREIRLALLPQYPPIPAAHQPGSRLPQPAKRRSPAPPRTPKAARRLKTPTPPETVKPRTRLTATRQGPSAPCSQRSSLSSDSDSDAEFVGRTQLDIAATPRAPRTTFMQGAFLDDEDEYLREAPSMTVRDILLQADTSHFDIISG